jgi:hypothetical protein
MAGERREEGVEEEEEEEEEKCYKISKCRVRNLVGAGYGNSNNKNDSGRPGIIGHKNSIISRADMGFGKNNTVERSDSIEGLTDNVIVQTLDYKVEFDQHSQRETTLRSQDQQSRSGHSQSTKDGDGDRSSIEFKGL